MTITKVQEEVASCLLDDQQHALYGIYLSLPPPPTSNTHTFFRFTLTLLGPDVFLVSLWLVVSLTVHQFVPPVAGWVDFAVHVH